MAWNGQVLYAPAPDPARLRQRPAGARSNKNAPMVFPLLRTLATALLLLGVSIVAAAASDQAAHRFFETSDGVRLHYWDAGRGESTLVFVPGWTMPAEIWKGQIERFSVTHRVIAFDPRGQGASAVPRNGYRVERRARDIAELLDQLGTRPVVLVGWSLGVLESIAYLKFHDAQRIQALVLVDNSIGEEPPPKFDPTFLSRLKKDRVKTVSAFVRSMYRRPQPESYYQRIVDASLQVPLDGAVALLSYPYPREFWKNALYATDLPVLYAVTERFRDQGENLKKHRPDAWVEVFPQAGHALFVDESERFNQLLEDFLRLAVRTRAAHLTGGLAP